MNNPLRDFARSCVRHYAKFEHDQYNLDVDDLDDFVREEFASLIMIDDPSRASESTGNDNPLFQITMLPALTEFLKNSDDQDERIEFLKAWREGTTSYNTPYMQELIDDALEDYNADQGYKIKDWNQHYRLYQI